jgi:hypothetical protein
VMSSNLFMVAIRERTMWSKCRNTEGYIERSPGKVRQDGTTTVERDLRG